MENEVSDSGNREYFIRSVKSFFSKMIRLYWSLNLIMMLELRIKLSFLMVVLFILMNILIILNAGYAHDVSNPYILCSRLSTIS